MFKYISEILAQFSRPQKIVALLMVLFSIVAITLAPSFISAMTVNCEELKSEVERQTKRVNELETLIDSLDYRIRKDQRECTNEITLRESEFIQMLEELKRDAKLREKLERETEKIYRMEETQMIPSDDRIVSSKKVITESPIKNKSSIKMMVNKIEKMQEKIKDNN